MVKRFACLLVLSGLIGFLNTAGTATADSLLGPTDFILAIDTDGNSSYPAAESPPQLLDGDAGTKYLNFGQINSGFIVTPSSGSSIVQSFQLTTANDAPERDPLTWDIYGTNDAVLSTDNSNATGGETWTLVGSGSTGLDVDPGRLTDGPVVDLFNFTSYTSYMMIFTGVRDSSTANSMQVADVTFWDGASGTGNSLLTFGDPILAVDLDDNSSYPGTSEEPRKAIDGTINKYLNFGGPNSGFIITPASGSDVVRSFQITTANDHEERDPAVWELYGTNDSIASTNNSDGLGESWALLDSGTVDLPTERDTLGSVVDVDNDTAYASYKMLFTDLRDAGTANSMQIAEVQFFNTSESGETLPGDLNGDGAVNSGDLDLVRGNWGQTVSPNTDGDATGDGFVNSADLDVVRGNWGATAAAAVPEPSSLALVAGVVVMGMICSRQRKT